MSNQRASFLLAILFIWVSFSSYAQRSRVGVYDDWETNRRKQIVDLYSFDAYMPKEGLKSVDFPSFLNKERAVSAYRPEEVMLVVSVGREHKAYPLSTLMYRPVINDRIGGTPVAVTYCPLTDQAVVWKRSFNYKGQTREVVFRTSGLLRNSNTVLYDQFTESWWQQYTGQALVGEFAGVELEMLSAMRMKVKDFYAYYPYGLTLTDKVREDIFPYGETPYYQYDQQFRKKPLLLRYMPESLLAAMERVAVVHVMNEQMIYPFEEIRKNGVINDKPMGMYLTLFYTEDIPSMHDERVIKDSKKVGHVVAYSSFLDGQLLTFAKEENNTFRDEETQSVWRLDGTCIEGSLKGKQLKAVVHTTSFAFAPTVFYPKATIYNFSW
ncbi:DUF3179 domain-containing (seleno)protein [Algivirga pacifica]|uniref:DUF3179 domain-containing protein n=1 Tax=Algivirga pacifica TaxID=1162670 RepID=A0ABP9DPC1_9BACT